MIYLQDEIDIIVRRTPGTWIKRRNLRRKLIKESNSEVTVIINDLKRSVRLLKAAGAKENNLRALYARITELEIKLI